MSPKEENRDGLYAIWRVINNNFVCAQDGDGKEIILRGPGIGFKKQAGDLVPAGKVEKVYALRDPEKSSRFAELLQGISEDFVDVSTRIIETAEKSLGRRLSENVYITLTDHICFAVERMKNNAVYSNQLLWEITNFYPAEYAIGQQALDLIEEGTGFRLPEDEAGFIALHIVNAGIVGKMGDMVRITEMIRDIMETVQGYYGSIPDEKSLDYGRFITHLKFLGQRILRNRYAKDDDAEFRRMIARRYENDYRCAIKIKEQLQKDQGVDLPGEEMMFLTVHLHRLALSMGYYEKEEGHER